MRQIFSILPISLVCLFAAAARSDVTPNNLFTDHMVLQSGTSVPVWGTAAPGEHIAVTLDGQKQTAVAGDDGKWIIHLSNLKTGGPTEMTVAGKNSVTIRDILIGEVWLASGQSNMQFPVGISPTVKAYNGVENMDQEIAAANYPHLRMFMVKPTTSAEPQDEAIGEWQVCTPDNVKAFGAVGYFFARDLQKQLNVPVGLINSSFGASTAEAWVSKPVMDSDPRLAGLMKDFQTALDSYTARPATTAATTTLAEDAKQPNGRAARGRGTSRSPYSNQHNPTVLWNGMLHLLQPYAIRGAIWYQGESVLSGTIGDKLYPVVMESLVKSWRKEWGQGGQGDFPFYVVQLAGQDAASNNPIIRESQAAILSLPNTGMATAIDIGERKNVHPKNKQDVGNRLSRIALANVYNKPIEYSGPIYQSMAVEGSAIRIKFTHLGGGLIARNGDLKTFVIAATNGKFVPATAKIDGDSVIVSSSEVPQPANVRYAWMNWPEGCNLYNKAGLPAPPFRTDRD